MMQLILQVFWFLLPAAFANMAPVLFKWIPFLNIPVDLNKKYKGKPIFGKNKTYRGFLVGILTAILIVYIQKLLYPVMQNYSLIDYSTTCVILLGFLLGFGALLGDLIESFFKRQKNIKPGKQWIPFDQLDWVIGALILAALYISLTWTQIIIALALFGLLHFVINLAGYYLGIKKNKF